VRHEQKLMTCRNGAGRMWAVADSDGVNRLEHDVLWDREGQEWHTKWARWATPKQASSFVGRDQPIAVGGTRPALDLDGALRGCRLVGARQAAL
jgi:hypothetical protein